jgi:putative hydrolase of HD superfamily
MQRWNDKIRPVELMELDKQAHKMIIAYFLGKFEEDREELDWLAIIEGGLFELLQRIVLTDLKPPVFYKIKANEAKYRQLNEWVYAQLESSLSCMGEAVCQRFRDYFTEPESSLNRRILNAAHFYATEWEFDILERIHPFGYEMAAIRERLRENRDRYRELKGLEVLERDLSCKNFIDLCGQLRFQARWAHIHRVPRTSVLGHLLFVAVLLYLFSLQIHACRRRCVNNYFTGLFHDLPEVLTRDIISPVKRSVEGLDKIIREYEKEMMEKEVYRLIPSSWHSEMRLFTENEFEGLVRMDGEVRKVTSEEIRLRYNEDRFDPRDGELVQAADRLAAFIEAYEAIRNGSGCKELQEARWTIKSEYEHSVVSGINFGQIYADFD